jgi:hypothetical protein
LKSSRVFEAREYFDRWYEYERGNEGANLPVANFYHLMATKKGVGSLKYGAAISDLRLFAPRSLAFSSRGEL